MYALSQTVNCRIPQAVAYVPGIDSFRHPSIPALQANIPRIHSVKKNRSKRHRSQSRSKRTKKAWSGVLAVFGKPSRSRL
jgi:hypothetical protein